MNDSEGWMAGSFRVSQSRLSADSVADSSDTRLAGWLSTQPGRSYYQFAQRCVLSPNRSSSQEFSQSALCLMIFRFQSRVFRTSGPSFLLVISHSAHLPAVTIPSPSLYNWTMSGSSHSPNTPQISPSLYSRKKCYLAGGFLGTISYDTPT